MFKKKENGFSLVELAVAAAVAVGLAVVAVSVVSGTAASVSAKGSSAASVESCTISESLAKAGGDEAAINCAGTSAAASASATPSPSPSAAQTGVIVGLNAGSVAAFSVDGVQYTAFDEAGSSWSTQKPVFTVALPQNGGFQNSDGYYAFEASSTNWQNNYGYWATDDVTSVVTGTTGAKLYYQFGTLIGFSALFDGNPFNGGKVIPNPNW
jgi:Tfp pilus assembly major pilin PilA